MDHDTAFSLLNDYIDGEISLEARRGIERHLHDCATCRQALTGLQLLLDDAAQLAKSIEPTRDLWQAIERNLDSVPWRQRSLWSLRYPLAAAAMLLIAISSLLTLTLIERGPPASAFEPTALLREWTVVEAGYIRAATQLTSALEARKRDLDPETVELIERNLDIIDAAIAETRAALAADPANWELVDLLASIYDKKIEVLRRTSTLETRL